MRSEETPTPHPGPPPALDLDRALETGATPSGASLSPGLASVLRDALETVRTAVERYGANAVATAFNGGKDATVVLHLTRAALCRVEDVRVTCMYLVGEAAFEEVDRFVRGTVDAFGVRAVEQGGGFKEGIQAFVEERGVKAFVMGTRRSDPHAAEMGALEPSSPGWPAFMRVNPILDWEYAHVWEFLRAFQLPYCELYDRGYTSIGNVRDTTPNPALAVGGGEERDGEQRVAYLPAWKLTDQGLERAGRVAASAFLKSQ
jgi:FAD synthetase